MRCVNKFLSVLIFASCASGPFAGLLFAGDITVEEVKDLHDKMRQQEEKNITVKDSTKDSSKDSSKNKSDN
jgi:hypothetical protein